MNSYLRIVTDRLLFRKLPTPETAQGHTNDDETKELIELMDNIPNAKSVATMYQRMNRTGELDKQYTTKDPAMKWLEMEQYVINREVRRRDTQQKMIFMVILFLILGFTSYLYGLQWLAAHHTPTVNTTVKRR